MDDRALKETAAAPAPESAEHAARVAEISAAIDFADPALTVAYGAKTMNEIAQFADGLLAQVRAKDSGPVGEILGNLLSSVKAVDINKIADDGGFLARLPGLGGLFDKFERQMRQFQTLAEQVDTVSDRLEHSMVGLLRDIEVLEQLYAHNKDHYRDLSLYIEAGKAKLADARAVDLPALQEKAVSSADSLDAQNVRDFAERLNRFERRLHDLAISRTVALQTVPQIRMIQGNNQTLAEKIQTSILTTIPLWKNQMVLAISLVRQKKGLKLQKDVSDATNALLLANATMLEDATIGTAREVERAVVDFDTIKAVHAKLISTIEETLRVAEEGKARRAEVEAELDNMETTLRQDMMALASKKPLGLTLEEQTDEAGTDAPTGDNAEPAERA